MMDLRFAIDDRAVNELLERLGRRTSNLKPLMSRIGAFYERGVLENFRDETSPDGTPWQPLSAATMMLGLGRKKGFIKGGGLSAKGKRYLQGKKILRESGDLQDTIHFQADDSKVTIGTSGSIPYAAIQQLGGQAGRGKKVTIPARPYLAENDGENLGLAEKDRRWIMEMIEKEMATWK